jgi:hypothetical protein
VFLDVGSGLGKPNLHAAPFVKYSIGIDSVFYRVHLAMQNLKRCAVDQRLVDNVHFTHCDVKGIGSLSPCTHVYAFDAALESDTMEALAKAFMNSNAKWIVLYKPLATVARFGFDVTLVNQIQPAMYVRLRPEPHGLRLPAKRRGWAKQRTAAPGVLVDAGGAARDNDAYREHVSAAAAAFVNQPRARRGSGYGDDAADEADDREEESDGSDDASACPSGDGRQRLSNQTVRYTPEATGSSQKKKRPKKKRGGRQQKRRQKRKGGFTNKTTREQRAQRIAGTSRSCLPDAVGHLVPALAESTARGAMLACIPEDGAPDMNTKFDSIASALQPFGYALPSVSERFNATGGPELALLKQTTGLYVVQLAITYGNDDPEPDLHCVAFDGQVVQDNSGHANAFATVESSDRASPGAAREVFNSLYPGLKAMVSQVYELVATGTVC